jgi:hypothetical protein
VADEAAFVVGSGAPAAGTVETERDGRARNGLIVSVEDLAEHAGRGAAQLEVVFEFVDPELWDLCCLGRRQVRGRRDQ